MRTQFRGASVMPTSFWVRNATYAFVSLLNKTMYFPSALTSKRELGLLLSCKLRRYTSPPLLRSIFPASSSRSLGIFESVVLEMYSILPNLALLFPQ